MTARAPQPPTAWPTLYDAQRRVLLEVIVHHVHSRAELARRTGLSKSSLARITGELVSSGFLSDSEIESVQGRGRPAEIIRLNDGRATFVGVKLTGDRAYAATVNLAGTVIAEADLRLGGRDVASVVARVADVVRRVDPERAAVALGLCLAGDVRGTVFQQELDASPFLGWEGTVVPLSALLEQATGLRSVVSNDVQALTAAHHWFGAGVGIRDLAVIGLGVGIGCGVVSNDAIVAGGRGHPGKIGHLPVTADGPRCDRGHVGCVSAYATIPAILANAGARTLDEVLSRAAAGDPVAHNAVEAGARALGAAIGYVVNLVDPVRVIVTGEGLAIGQAAVEPLRESLAARLDPAAELPQLDFQPFAFSDYAWAAGVSAIRGVLERS